jgi:predicted lipoprotein with Yx(FWY)xxD motif
MKKLLFALAVVAALAAPASAMAMTERSGARPTLTIRNSSYGRVLFDGRGFVLYAFTADTRGRRSNCYGACARAWPVYYAPAGKLRAGPGVKQSLLATVRRRDGRRQVTYAGWPLYYYVGDNAPGVIRCQNVLEFGGLWLVQRPTGSLVRGS